MGAMTLWRDTLQQLIRPHRAVPIALVAVPLLVAQHQFSVDKRLANTMSVLLVGGFVLFGPWSWRQLWRGPSWSRWLWPLTGVAPFALAFAMSEWVEAFPTYLLNSTTGATAAALYLVGSWGLGRDIELETGLAEASERAEALQRTARSAQILALQAHLDPHFLFNTLNAIAEWCVVDGERAEEAVLDLSQVLRKINEAVQQEWWSLNDEVALARRVLELHQARDPDRFVLEVLAEPSGQQVPPLLLLPLIENAVTHGPAKGHVGPIRLVVEEDREVRVTVENGGSYGGPRSGGQGLALVRDRAALAWGDAAVLEIEAMGERTRACLRWPVV